MRGLNSLAFLMDRLVMIVIAIVFQFPVGNTFAQDTKQRNDTIFAPNQLSEDYKVLVKTLREAYPSTYRYNTKIQLDAFFNRILARLDKPMRESQFYPLIGLTVAYMKDEHIISAPSEWYYEHIYKKDVKFLPFSIKVIGGRMYVNASENSQLKTGTQIKSIDSVPATSVIGGIIPYIHRDGYISTFLYRHLEDYSPTQNENLFDLTYSFLHQLRDSVKLTVRMPDGKVNQLYCRTLNHAQYQAFYWKRNPHEPPLSLTLINEKSALLTISSFHSSYRENYKQDFEKLFEQSFSKLDNNKTRNLIIDLRRCEGGDNTYLLLLQYLMLKPFQVLDYIEVSYAGLPSTSKYFESTDNALFPDSLLYRLSNGRYRLKNKYRATIGGYTITYPKQNNFKGRIYVLTSGATGSAAAIFCSFLRNSHRATFIGEETGGAMEGPTSLNVPVLVLPNSKIRIEIPLIKLQLAVRYKKGRGVIPDFPLEQTKSDLIANRDTQLNFALKLLCY